MPLGDLCPASTLDLGGASLLTLPHILAGYTNLLLQNQALVCGQKSFFEYVWMSATGRPHLLRAGVLLLSGFVVMCVL